MIAQNYQMSLAWRIGQLAHSGPALFLISTAVQLCQSCADIHITDCPNHEPFCPVKHDNTTILPRATNQPATTTPKLRVEQQALATPVFGESRGASTHRPSQRQSDEPFHVQ